MWLESGGACEAKELLGATLEEASVLTQAEVHLLSRLPWGSSAAVTGRATRLHRQFEICFRNQPQRWAIRSVVHAVER